MERRYCRTCNTGEPPVRFFEESTCCRKRRRERTPSSCLPFRLDKNTESRLADCRTVIIDAVPGNGPQKNAASMRWGFNTERLAKKGLLPPSLAVGIVCRAWKTDFTHCTVIENRLIEGTRTGHAKGLRISYCTAFFGSIFLRIHSLETGSFHCGYTIIRSGLLQCHTTVAKMTL